MADATMFGNRMTEAGCDFDGNGVIEENELVDLQRLNYSNPGGMRRGEMQVPAGGFSRYAQSMCNKAKAERVRREQRERELLGSPHCPKGTMVRLTTGELATLSSWRGSDLVSGSGALQPLIKENGATPTRVFVASKKSDGKLKNHETKDRALVTSKVALPKKRTPPSGTANTRSPLSGSHSSDMFDDAHDAFKKDEHTERARLHAQTGRPAPKVAPTPETEERHQAALALTSRSAPHPSPNCCERSSAWVTRPFLASLPRTRQRWSRPKSREPTIRRARTSSYLRAITAATMRWCNR